VTCGQGWALLRLSLLLGAFLGAAHVPSSATPGVLAPEHDNRLNFGLAAEEAKSEGYKVEVAHVLCLINIDLDKTGI
jgi:hypothetical protein